MEAKPSRENDALVEAQRECMRDVRRPEVTSPSGMATSSRDDGRLLFSLASKAVMVFELKGKCFSGVLERLKAYTELMQASEISSDNDLDPSDMGEGGMFKCGTVRDAPSWGKGG